MCARQPSSSFQGWQHRVCVSIALRWVCSSIFVAEFREDVRIAIPAIAEGLKDSHSHVRSAAIELLPWLAAESMCQHRSPVGVLKHICSRISGGRSDPHSCHCGRSEGFSFSCSLGSHRAPFKAGSAGYVSASLSGGCAQAYL